MQQRAEKSHYQSKVFVFVSSSVCVSSSCADAVDRLLIYFVIGLGHEDTRPVTEITFNPCPTYGTVEF